MLSQFEYDGIEVDVLSVGDADCIVVTQWVGSFPHRILIDGGSNATADAVSDFLLRRGFTNFWSVVCTHPHNDHARGLIQIIRNRSFTFHRAWMHDIRRHLRPDTLRSASRANEGVNQVVETTDELRSAFQSRGVSPEEPFSDIICSPVIAGWPSMVVLGPSVDYYNEVISEFTDVVVPGISTIPVSSPSAYDALFALAGTSPRFDSSSLSALASLGLATEPAPTPQFASLLNSLGTRNSFGGVPFSPRPLFGALRNSSLQESPSTQPFNNTSVILGVVFKGSKLLFTGDAGSDALAQVGSEWNRLMYMGVPHHASDGNLSQRDAERFCPEFAFISAKGDSSHPSQAVVSALVKVGARVYSTHRHGHLWFHCGAVPFRADYGWIEPLKGRGLPEPVIDWSTFLPAVSR